MGIPNSALNAMVAAWTALGAYTSLHTAAAGTTGASEASGGSYSRVQSTPGTATAGVQTGSQVNILCAANTYVEAGEWSASTAGTFNGSAAFGGGSVVVSGTGASINVTPTWTT